MIKMASGVAAAAAGGPRGFMLLMATAVAIAIPSAFWTWGALIPLIVWLALNGAMLVVSTLACAALCSDGVFDWKDIDQVPVFWSLMAAWRKNAKPSWFRLVIWMLLIPAELVASIVLWPLSLVVRALLNPMPGEWN